ncbi:Cytochrome d ubiquinol oxidase subunit II [Acinetobacter haemolyticus CIP 64.3 = MTCC 9819]|uniref:Cytochrome d ubiquinol oxidase, subunit II n=1 Tax=Acinetobacter haemolyticus CIP 64.3 = MTCC 9819 TaxID=1217659 RepID=N9GJJ3_ACIHA|nr:cytochrome d ubiquinol oxidase subunit II [Acinetobacter haemolyticus]ENW19665.1 cytochrome d ubiquinol oxidase, subunit II [Acinetobacter haemolyticus CIP 64.3 = MTCC 9819]EPR88065.1 Cytochrome d ubiquinol oxidase subunit II [Acinetobacter haemolyticus CIP 64.3 = MTCC 9819]QXZ26116.1 cytochrome d ubiquinol oxidase subunit II [Acinetobacter haemolyticus]SPT49224.1 cytochrome D ubiquinol oxidase subunit II [Acinetobacter haemolyticus]SUU60080.1 cytochrome D ubiquinol oxidase subunit II [Acin
MIEYELLKIIWWVLVGVLLIGFALTDGFDMGAMALMPFVGKTDNERRAAINTIAPHWDGNQVWFITAGGALFAAWPMVYAVAFSGMYWALLLVLFALFLRPVGFDYRSKLENMQWRTSWDWGLCIGGAVPALVFGVAFGNLFLGVPFGLDETLRSQYTGSFFALLNPFALVCGIVSLSMLCAHGGSWLMLRTDGDLFHRSAKATQLMAAIFLACFLVAGAWLYFGGIEGYSYATAIDTNAALNPLAKEVVTNANHGWMNNYLTYPITVAAPVAAILGAILALISAGKQKAAITFTGTSLMIVGAILTAGFALFPFLLPSNIDPTSSLTMWDAVSSHKTLGVMTVAACIFVPLILIYTSWSYYKMWGVITSKHIEENSHSLY